MESEHQIAQAVFQATNQTRAAFGLYPLRWSPALANCANQHNLYMKSANTLAHQLPGEFDLGVRERQHGVDWVWASENVGVTYNTTLNGVLGLHQTMMDEVPPYDSHRQNILTTSANIVGIAVLFDQYNAAIWLTVDFAQV